MPKKILIVVGTRPNFIKITQFDRVFAKHGDDFEYRLLHTGQHYDRAMSKVFFEQLKLREPDYYLQIAGGSPAVQMGKIITHLSDVITEWKPDLVMVVGDVNSTFAAALTANKHQIPLAHLESGLRSRDRGMPEEINRILTDEITDFFFVTEQSGIDNLKAEGKKDEQIFFVGNTMIDTLVAFDDAIAQSPIMEDLSLTEGEPFVLVTMHRPANVDTAESLEKMIQLLAFTAERYRIILPLHPRTKNRLEQFGLWEKFSSLDRLTLTGPMDYLAFQRLISQSTFVLTDSGGIQEETTFRQVACITLRPNTERPSTIDLGTNELASFDLAELTQKIDRIANGTYKQGQIPPLWDGKSTERIVSHLKDLL